MTLPYRITIDMEIDEHDLYYVMQMARGFAHHWSTWDNFDVSGQRSPDDACYPHPFQVEEVR